MSDTKKSAGLTLQALQDQLNQLRAENEALRVSASSSGTFPDPGNQVRFPEEFVRQVYEIVRLAEAGELEVSAKGGAHTFWLFQEEGKSLAHLGRVNALRTTKGTGWILFGWGIRVFVEDGSRRISVFFGDGDQK